MDRQLDQDVKIDRFHLEVDCVEHAGIYRYWSEEKAKATGEKARAEIGVKVAKAEALLSIRAEATAGRMVIKNAEEMAAMVETAPPVREANERWMKAIEAVEMLWAATSAMEERSKRLDNLVYLWGKNYYSAPGQGARSSGADSAEIQSRTSLGSRDNQKGD